MPSKVLGVDLASRSWKDNGTCVVSFDEITKSWDSIRLNCIDWPDKSLTPAVMASTLHDFLCQERIMGISLDGPQGWREPNAPRRKGVGRVCEYEARCQGKTGEYGSAYPRPQLGWIQFCVDVFAELRKLGGQTPRGEEWRDGLDKLRDGNFWVIECFPTSIWRTSGLAPLPGKTRCLRNRIDLSQYRNSLAAKYSLPSYSSSSATHDDLQALVSALPLTALLGAPVDPVPRGKDGWQCEAGYWVEGLIWDCKPHHPSPTEITCGAEAMVLQPHDDSVVSNPLLIDDRDDTQAEVLARGVKIFEKLCHHANIGEPLGCGYAQFVECLFGQRFQDVVGRKYSQSDTGYVLELAYQITEEAGGRKSVNRAGNTIEVGMDSFIWKKKSPHDRNVAAFARETFTKQEWLHVFPDGERSLIGDNFEEWLAEDE